MHTPQHAAYLLGNTDWPKADHLWPLLIALAIYVVGAIIVRVVAIEGPARLNVRRKISELQQAATPRPADGATACDARAHAADLVQRAGKLLDSEGGSSRAGGSLNRTIAAHRLLHAADEALVATMSTKQVAAEYAVRVPKGSKTAPEKQRAALLVAMRAEHTRWDNEHETAAGVHRRAMFVLLGAVVLLVLLAAAGCSQRAMVLAAAAGLLGAALRIGREKSVVTDYGLRWSTVLLAPVVSALCATLGLMLIAGMRVGGLVGETFAPACTDAGWAAELCVPIDPADDAAAGSADDGTATCACEETVSDTQGASDSTAAGSSAVTAPDTGSSSPGTLGLSPIGAMLVVGLGFSERFFQRWIQHSIDSFDPDRTASSAVGTASPT